MNAPAEAPAAPLTWIQKNVVAEIDVRDKAAIRAAFGDARFREFAQNVSKAVRGCTASNDQKGN